MKRKQTLRLAALVLALCCMLLNLASVVGQSPAARSPETAVTLAIVGGRLIEGYGGAPLENAVVLISGDTITEIGRVGQLAVPPGAQVVDAEGMTIMPGLWESHGHLFHIGEGRPTEFQERFADRALEIMASVAETSLMAGITTFRDTGGPLAEQQKLRREIETGARKGPRLFLAGPILRQSERNAPATPGDFSVTTPAEARAAAEQLIAQKVDQIKVYGFWDLEVLQEITGAAHRAGIGVDADVRHMEAYRTAVRAGVDRLHHVFTADSLSDYSDEDLRLLIRGEKPIASGPSANILRGPYIVPTIQMRNAYVRVLRFPELIDHPSIRRQFAPDVYAYLRATWENPPSIPWGIGAPERVEVARRKLQRFIEAGGREQLVAGCDAGAPFNIHSPLAREIENLVRAGLSPMEGIQAATLRPAQMQGVDARLGTVSKGKLADILVVDGDPLQDITLLQHAIVRVIKGGEVFR